MMPIVIVIVVAAIALVAWAVIKNRSTTDEALTDQVRRFTEHDVTALTEQIRRVGAPPEATEELDHARECERRANDALANARHPADVQAATAAVAEGFYAVQCAQAAVEGRQPPEQRRPCYFDPAHGLSVVDVDWAPAGEPPARRACLPGVCRGRCAPGRAHRADSQHRRHVDPTLAGSGSLRSLGRGLLRPGVVRS